MAKKNCGPNKNPQKKYFITTQINHKYQIASHQSALQNKNPTTNKHHYNTENYSAAF